MFLFLNSKKEDTYYGTRYCGSCEAECPVGAISEGDGKYEIDADACVDCGACEAACPTGAISAE